MAVRLVQMAVGLVPMTVGMVQMAVGLVPMTVSMVHLAVHLRCNCGYLMRNHDSRTVDRIDDREGPAPNLVIHSSKVFAQNAQA